jgi:hypothetical protein
MINLSIIKYYLVVPVTTENADLSNTKLLVQLHLCILRSITNVRNIWTIRHVLNLVLHRSTLLLQYAQFGVQTRRLKGHSPKREHGRLVEKESLKICTSNSRRPWRMLLNKQWFKWFV